MQEEKPSDVMSHDPDIGGAEVTQPEAPSPEPEGVVQPPGERAPAGDSPATESAGGEESAGEPPVVNQ